MGASDLLTHKPLFSGLDRLTLAKLAAHVAAIACRLANRYSTTEIRLTGCTSSTGAVSASTGGQLAARTRYDWLPALRYATRRTCTG